MRSVFRSGRLPARIALPLAAGALACAGAAPVVETHVIEIDRPALERIAVVPFLPSPQFKGDAPAGEGTGAEAADAAALTTRFATEAFAAQGFDVIPASDVALLFETRGQVVPHGETATFAREAAREFGATALLTGEVYRYRARQGGELGATHPASVGYELALYAAPDGRLLWKARFDKTQVALSENLFEARRYPGRGSRWLSAADLARWGADVAAEQLLELRQAP